MSHGSHDIKSEVKGYYKVFAVLMILTIATVAVANWHLGVVLGITVALIIATVKASLVVSFFMHLIAEKKAIYVLMGFTLFFFVSMIALILYGSYSVPQKTEFLHYEPAIQMHIPEKNSDSAEHTAAPSSEKTAEAEETKGVTH